jgi:hypothetical protein
MTQTIFGHVFTLRTLIRVALTALSLSGIAHARAPDGGSQQQSGNNYNFLAGGGG